eukprot:TRINITY_DN101897_c0_g1_i1.p1 TRINITY_DN101897_c0_g1~~TRINITY_DN101897_c0_g1_i1.p1  ORF type:complete len:507 (+),score=124.76 TRINITY_DN101897_c0_g1_i1:46-1521(+)
MPGPRAAAGTVVASGARRNVAFGAPQCRGSTPAALRSLSVAASADAVKAATGLFAEGGQQQRRSFAAGNFGGGFHYGGFPGAGAGPPRGNSSKYYDLLGISREASETEIKSAYKKQAMKHHPDKGGDETKFKEISKAYEVLSDAQKKQLYDMYGEEGLDGMGQGAAGPQAGMDPFDLFSQMFGFDARRQQRGRPVTPDSVYELQVTLEEMYAGTKREIVFNRDALCNDCNGKGGTEVNQCEACGGNGYQVRMQQLGMMVQQIRTECSVCNGKGHVISKGCMCPTCKGACTVKEKKPFLIDVEAGGADGQEFRFRNQADERPDHDTGDVVIRIRQQDHKVFARARDSLYMTKKISLAEALCGFQFSTKFLDGEDLVIRSKAGQITKPGDMIVVEGKGMPRPHGQKPGDLFVHLDVEFPKEVPSAGHDKLRDVLGGEQLSEDPPLGAAFARQLSDRQSKDARARLAEAARAGQQRRNGQGGQGGQEQVQCQQM